MMGLVGPDVELLEEPQLSGNAASREGCTWSERTTSYTVNDYHIFEIYDITKS